MKGEELKKAFLKINVPENLPEEILISAAKSAAGTKKEKIFMSKRTILAAAAIVAVLGVGVFAAVKNAVSIGVHSSSNPDYTSFPTREQCVSDAGFEAKLVESFDNGYTFKEGRTATNTIEDGDGNTTENYKSLLFDYEKDGDVVVLSQDNHKTPLQQDGDGSAAGCTVFSEDGVEYRYYSYTQKFVPVNYEYTDEDKAAAQRGELVFGVGSDKVKISRMQHLQWELGGISFELFQSDGKLSHEDLLSMAKQLNG